MGGLLWATYKATCRRNGVFHGSAGPRNFNEELFEPISKHLASGWERAFQRRLPACFDSFIRTVRALLETFHREATQRARERGSNFHGLTILAQQLHAHAQHIADIRGAVIGLMQDLQRDANRSFTPVIQDEMRPAYEGCVEERGEWQQSCIARQWQSPAKALTNGRYAIGPGSFMRMKNIMVTHVAGRQRAMFRNATDVVQSRLEDMCQHIRQVMEAHVQNMYTRLSRDYLAVLVGTDAASMGTRIPRAELMLRAEMAPLLAEVDEEFAELFTGQVPSRDGGPAADDAQEEQHVFVKSEPESTAQDAVSVKNEAC